MLDLTYAIFCVLSSPYILFRMATSKRFRAGFKERAGAIPKRSGEKPLIWLHAASVGEVNLSASLLDALRREHPDWELAVSTNTNTGQKVARDKLCADFFFYYPLDFSPVVGRVLKRLRPSCIVLVELEVWPNLLRKAARAGIPVIVVNGRIREESLKRYRMLKKLAGNFLALSEENVFCVQNETYADRFRRLGVPEQLIRITGNMKYDTAPTEVDEERCSALAARLGLRPDDTVLVAGSTWAGEEEILLGAYAALKKEFSNLRLVLVPKHIERADEVAGAVRAAGFEPRRLTRSQKTVSDDAIRIIDTVGELVYAYSLASCVFVGRSLTPGGGQNMLEPAALGKAALVGPHTENFAAETEALLAAHGLIVVEDEASLTEALRRFLSKPDLAESVGERARAVVRAGRGATARNVEAVLSVMGRVMEQ